jgi:formate-nitrite transporter family protein
MSDERRSEIGASDEPVEDEVVESFDAIVEEGAERLNRTWAGVLVTGLSGGIEIGIGVMAYLAVLHETGSHLLAGLAFSAGFIALLLAHSELFTENFLVPIAALAAKEGTPSQLAKLWGGTLIANLAGGWLVMLLVVAAFPAYRSTLVESARHYLDLGVGWEGVSLALLGGMAITLMTRMQHGTDSDVAKIAAAVVGGLLLAGLQLMHSVLDSLLIFGAITVGEADLWQWLRWFVPTVVLNAVGGILLVTVLRLIRSKELLEHARH